MLPLDLVICIFATWRLSSLFAREEGPFRIFTQIRIMIFKGTVYNNIVGKIMMTLNNGIGCIMCNSVWFGSLLAIPFSTNAENWFYNALSFSAGAILFEAVYDKLGR